MMNGSHCFSIPWSHCIFNLQLGSHQANVNLRILVGHSDSWGVGVTIRKKNLQVCWKKIWQIWKYDTQKPKIMGVATNHVKSWLCLGMSKVQTGKAWAFFILNDKQKYQNCLGMSGVWARWEKDSWVSAGVHRISLQAVRFSWWANWEVSGWLMTWHHLTSLTIPLFYGERL